MKEELRSESQAEMGRAEKSEKPHFSAPLIFLPSFRWVSNRGDQSNLVKPGQTDAAGWSARQIVCNYFTINALQLKYRPSSFRPISTNFE
jgi:hypothetical protein